MKTLTINGEIYARYEIENDLIFIKSKDPELYEEILIHLIMKIENIEFKGAAYLNVDLETGETVK